MIHRTVKEYFNSYNLGERVQEFAISSATVELAAQAVGCKISEIAKTLSFLVNDKAVLIVAAGNTRIDNQKFKSIFSSKPKMIAPHLLEEYTGYPMGGVCPFLAQPNVSIYLDVSLKTNNIVYPAAGSSNSAVRLSLSELEKHSNYKKWIDVCKVVL